MRAPSKRARAAPILLDTGGQQRFSTRYNHTSDRAGAPSANAQTSRYGLETMAGVSANTLNLVSATLYAGAQISCLLGGQATRSSRTQGRTMQKKPVARLILMMLAASTRVGPANAEILSGSVSISPEGCARTLNALILYSKPVFLPLKIHDVSAGEYSLAIPTVDSLLTIVCNNSAQTMTTMTRFYTSNTVNEGTSLTCPR